MNSENLRLFSFMLFSLPIFIIDIRSKRIPDIFSLGGICTLFVLDALTHNHNLVPNGITALFAAALFWGIRKATDGIGLGDIKLAGLVGFYLGPIGTLMASSLSAVAGIAYAGYAIHFKKESHQLRIPYAPFLLSGAYIARVALFFKLDSLIY